MPVKIESKTVLGGSVERFKELWANNLEGDFKCKQ
jgi:hypothetical protein